MVVVCNSDAKISLRTDHWHEVVDTLDSVGVGEQIHDEVAEVRAVGLRHNLQRSLKVFPLDSQERVAGKRWNMSVRKLDHVHFPGFVKLKSHRARSFLARSDPLAGSAA